MRVLRTEETSSCSRPGAVRVLIADAVRLRRAAVRQLQDVGAVEVVGDVDRADRVAAAVAEHAPDVLLLALQMDRSTLLDIATLAARTRIVLLVGLEHDAAATIAGVRAGAAGVIGPGDGLEVLAQAIAAVAAGGCGFRPTCRGRRYASFGPLTPIR